MAAPEYCPTCGAPVPEGARACPECGSDEETGWAEGAYAAKLGIPDEEFDYEEFTRNEFGQKEREVKPRGIHWVWWLIAVALLLLLAAGFIF